MEPGCAAAPVAVFGGHQGQRRHGHGRRRVGVDGDAVDHPDRGRRVEAHAQFARRDAGHVDAPRDLAPGLLSHFTDAPGAAPVRAVPDGHGEQTFAIEQRAEGRTRVGAGVQQVVLRLQLPSEQAVEMPVQLRTPAGVLQAQQQRDRVRPRLQRETAFDAAALTAPLRIRHGQGEPVVTAVVAKRREQVAAAVVDGGGRG